MRKMDFHVHALDNSTTVAQSIQNFEAYCQRNNFDGICIHAVPVSSIITHTDCNEKALAISKANANWYAFAGLHHDQNFIEQTKRYMDQGFRGIKLLEGKPSLYRYYGYGFEHPRFDEFFAFAAENAIPLLIHNNDPLKHWDINKISKSTIEKGWYYDHTMPSQEHFFKVLEDVFRNHPTLHAAIAHFGFYSDNLPRATRLMEDNPNLLMDMTPASIIFDELSATPEETRAFILKYQDRLLFGTDVSNNIDGSVLELNIKKLQIMNVFYEESGSQKIENHAIAGMNLPKEILQKIYHNNAVQFMGV